MGYFDDENNVSAYEKMVQDDDGQELVERLRLHLGDGSSVLELGMGPGKDLDLLKRHFSVTGSDTSQVFLERYRKREPTADLLLLDAETLNTPRRFAAIYSNKVLHHLSRQAARRSLLRQVEVLKPDGIALHSFWYGEQEEEHHGMRFVYYTERTLRAAIPSSFEIVELERYSELSEDDSIVLVLTS